MDYCGNSAIINFKGQTIFENENEEIIHAEILQKEALNTFREKFPVHLDSDSFAITK